MLLACTDTYDTYGVFRQIRQFCHLESMPENEDIDRKYMKSNRYNIYIYNNPYI